MSPPGRPKGESRSAQHEGLQINTRHIVSAGALYGLADVVVLAVGGFLLLPLYTRTLSQAEFGAFIIIKANIDILSCVLHLGLVSAAARVYFDHRQAGQQAQYMVSVLLFFGLVLLGATALLALWGPAAWALLSPGVPALPYLWFVLALAAAAFMASLASTWLRLDARVRAFTALQLASAALLAGLATANLAWFKLGLPGLLLALLGSAMLGVALLPWLFGTGTKVRLDWAHVRESLRYGLPIMVGLLAYVVLNRICTLILQRHVSLEELAIFGLAQQLALLVSLAGAAYGKAMQPAVFRAEAAQFAALLRQAAQTFFLLMTSVTCMVLLFASDIVAVVAPRSYQGGHDVLLLLIVASFLYSASLIADTALLYSRRPRASAAASLAGAALAVVLGLALIPQFGLLGGAAAMAGAFLGLTLLSHTLARRATGLSFLHLLAPAGAACCAVALGVAWLQRQALSWEVSLAIRLALAAALLWALRAAHAHLNRAAA